MDLICSVFVRYACLCFFLPLFFFVVSLFFSLFPAFCRLCRFFLWILSFFLSYSLLSFFYFLFSVFFFGLECEVMRGHDFVVILVYAHGEGPDLGG